MAVYTSNATGLWSAGGTWVGGVKPPSGAGHSIVIAAAHTVTYDEAAGEYGDDTTTAIYVRGVLKASRAATTSLTCLGQIYTEATTTANIDWGTVADPITSTYTATLILNKSASPANQKYGLLINDLSNFSAVGAPRTVNTTLVGAITAGATSATVTSATGWRVGDKIVLASTNGTYNGHDKVTLLTVNTGTGAITWTGGTTYAHAASCPVGHFSNNVTIKSNYTNADAFVCMDATYSSSVDGRRALQYAALEYVGGSESDIFGKNLLAGRPGGVVAPLSIFDSITMYQCGSGANPQFGVFGLAQPGITLTNVATFNDASATTYIALYMGYASTIAMSNYVMYFNTYYGILSAYGEGGTGWSFTDCTWWACQGDPIAFSAIVGGTFTRCKWKYTNIGYFANTSKGGPIKFIDCSFSGSDLVGTNQTYGQIFSAGSGALMNLQATNCKFITTTNNFYNGMYNVANPQLFCELIDKDSSPTSQEIYTPAGSIIRDNSTYYRSTSSVRFNTLGTAAQTKTFSFLTQSGVANVIVGYLRKNSTYGGSTLPGVSISGLGITPVTFTMTNSVDTWEKFTLTATQSTGSAGNLVFTFTGQSATSTGQCFLDGVVQAPFVTSARHYGYVFDTLPTRTVDPVIQQTTEATVGAYSGISISGSTITLTANRTIRELYDYCKYFLCQTANLAVADFFTSTDGVNFSSTYNIVINGCNLTGTGAIVTTGTITTPSSGTSTVIITGSNGKTGYITITGLSAHAVYVADNSLAQIDYQASVTGTYNRFIPAATTGSWTYVVKKAGYTYQRSTVTASVGGLYTIAVNTPQKLNPDGSAMYTASSSAFCTVAFTGITQATINIANGSVTCQQVFDTTETALITNNGMIWLASKAETSIFLSFGGNYFFMSALWRLKRASAGDVNAAIGAYVQSADGTVVDGTNGGVLFLTSSTAADIWAYLAANVTTTGSMGLLAKNNLPLIPAAL